MSKINKTLINNVEDLDIVMPMLEHSDNYSMTPGSLWNYIEMKMMVLIMLPRVNHLNLRQK